MKILSLDLSIKSSGFALFEDGELIKHGVIYPEAYVGHSKDKTPKKPVKFSKSIAERVYELIVTTLPDKIIIEDVSQGGMPGIKAIKSLIMLHGIILARSEQFLDKVQYLAPSAWRKALEMRLSTADKEWNRSCTKKEKIGWKHLSVRYINDIYGITLGNDECDAICVGLAAIELDL